MFMEAEGGRAKLELLRIAQLWRKTIPIIERRCRVGAKKASVARLRSRETTTSLPSRVPSLIVASFMVLFSSGQSPSRQ